tara:strand:- start:712 stop:1266 length:555 start_codon:yes stop_codon:yes gene_type:complete
MSQTYTVVNYTNLANLTAATGSASSGVFAPLSSHSVLRIQTTGADGAYFNIVSATGTPTADVNNPIVNGETFVNVPSRSANVSTVGADNGSDDIQIIFDLPNDHHHPFNAGELLEIKGNSVAGYNTHTPTVENSVNSTCITVASTGGALGQGTGGRVRLAYKIAVERAGAADCKVTVSEVTAGN